MKKGNSIIISLLAVVLIAASKKHSDQLIVTPVNKVFEIGLDIVYWPAIKIDFAIAVWEVSEQVECRKFLSSGDTLRLPLEFFSKENDITTIQLQMFYKGL